MPRLFTAIFPPADLRERLARLQSATGTPIPTARWVRPEHLHMTLVFLGDVEEAQAAAVEAALASVEATRFSLTVQGVERFPPSLKKAPRVLWAGVTNHHAPTALYVWVEMVVMDAGLSPEPRPYTPHITLARLKTHKPTPEADRFLAAHRDYHAGQFEVGEFVLVESVLSPQGPHYTIRARYALQ